MTVKENLAQLLEELPEERVHQLLEFAKFLRYRDEWEEWQRLGQAEFAKAYGPGEPTYSLADIKQKHES